jgi:hypothetical protein
MEFKDFIKQGQVRIASKDIALAKSLIRNTKKDLEFLKNLKVDENSSRKIMANYYEALRSILEAISTLDGYKIYSHEAFTYFLKNKQEETLSIKFDRFRKIRNAINYYGEDIEVENTKENIIEIKNMIDLLIKKYLGDIE